MYDAFYVPLIFSNKTGVDLLALEGGRPGGSGEEFCAWVCCCALLLARAGVALRQEVALYVLGNILPGPPSRLPYEFLHIRISVCKTTQV